MFDYSDIDTLDYSTGDPMLLSGVIQEVTGMTAFEFARQNLFNLLNITNVRWDKDRDDYTSTAWGLYTTVRDYAKFGWLFLNKGRWEDRQIQSEAWVEKSTKTDPSVNMWAAYGHLWHVNLPYRLKWSKSPVLTDSIPEDGYMAEGILGQNIIIIPSRDLVIVRVATQTRGGMKITALISNSGRVTIYSVRKNKEQMGFIKDYLNQFGLKAHFA